jgi:class 3 adenylate cyclase
MTDLFTKLLSVRIAVAFLIMLLFGLSYARSVSRFAFPLSLIGAFIVAGDVEAAIVVTGGYHSPFQTGLILLVIGVGLFFPYSAAQMSIAYVIVWVVYLVPIIVGRETIDIAGSGFFINSFFLICSGIIAVTASHLTSRLRKKEFFSRQALKEEQAKSEHLLLNILPEPIAKRLKDGEEQISDSFNEVTVLFADIVRFTSLSEHLPPVDLVALLNEIFSRFDRLAEKYGLEKIKTVGDAYMVVGGLPSPKKDHAEAVAAMALEMVEETAHFNERTGNALDIRVGINSGPVVAGVIGKKKFSYDLWGDTVNTASRMESHGAAGRIHVTETTYDQLCKSFEFEERGVIDIKDKGEMRTYFLSGRRSSGDPA